MVVQKCRFSVILHGIITKCHKYQMWIGDLKKRRRGHPGKTRSQLGLVKAMHQSYL